MAINPTQSDTADTDLAQFVDDSQTLISAESEAVTLVAGFLQSPYDPSTAEELVGLLGSDRYRDAQQAARRLGVDELGGSI